MASRCGVSRSYLANMEDGRRPVTRRIVAIYGEVYPDMMRRREVIAFLAAAATVTPAVLALDLEAALASEATGLRGLDDWRQVLSTRATDYMSIAKVPTVRAGLFGDLTILRSGRSTPRHLELTSRFATLFGQTSPTSTGPQNAIGWFERGIAHADASGDNAAQVWSRARAAQVLESTPELHPRALRWAEEAVAVAQQPTTGLVWAHLTRAALGARDDRELSGELDAADRALAVSGSDSAGSDYDIAYWRHQVSVSGILAGLGHPRAAAVTDKAEAVLPAGHARYAVHLQLHRAAIEHDAGDRAGARQRAREAYDRLPADQRSLSMRTFLGELAGEHRPHRPIVLKRRW